MRSTCFRATVLFAIAVVLAAVPGEGSDSASSPERYAGSWKCAPCHQIQYKGWIKTFHSTVVRDARRDPSAVMGDMKSPDLPFSTGDIDLTIGGHWDQRYLKRIGDDYYILPRLWSIQSRKWRPYSTYGWQRRPYSKYCIGCHSVGFDPVTKGIVEHSVGCESCHAPGREHARKPERGNIVNPARLSGERASEICAACHVRGKDPSGEYFFPIGYIPGDDLSKFLVPLEKKEGESDRDAIHRIWSKWKEDRESQARSRCEVCGIHQSERPKGAQSLSAICMSCHEYGDRLSEHTRHRADVAIGCDDCHRQKDNSLNENRGNDVHSYGYFLIHPVNCWDKAIQQQCVKCHLEKTEIWAYDLINTWKPPVLVDH